MVEIGHRIANHRTASWAAVTSDPQQEHEAWTKAGGRDSLVPIRVPPFTEEEARELLARRIFESLEPKVTPTSQQLDGIKETYASTLAFICGAVGTRARWLLHLLQARPMADAELASAGMTVDRAFDGCLPAGLCGGNLRVDPQVWAQFTHLANERKDALKPLLAVPYYFALPPHPPPPASPEDLAAQRVLAIDAALQDLLKAAQGSGAAEEKPAPTAKGAPIGLTFGSLANKYFRDHEADLRQLCAKHVLFYNHGARTVEFESNLMQRITASWLDEPLHKDGMQLLKKLLAWQAAKQVQADAKEDIASSKGSGWLSWAASAAAAEALASANARVAQLDGEISAIRKQLCLLP